MVRDALVELVASEVIASHSRQALGSFVKVLNYVGQAAAWSECRSHCCAHLLDADC